VSIYWRGSSILTWPCSPQQLLTVAQQTSGGFLAGPNPPQLRHNLALLQKRELVGILQLSPRNERPKALPCSRHFWHALRDVRG